MCCQSSGKQSFPSLCCQLFYSFAPYFLFVCLSLLLPVSVLQLATSLVPVFPTRERKWRLPTQLACRFAPDRSRRSGDLGVASPRPLSPNVEESPRGASTSTSPSKLTKNNADVNGENQQAHSGIISQQFLSATSADRGNKERVSPEFLITSVPNSRRRWSHLLKLR